jgi:hypothetical protein
LYGYSLTQADATSSVSNTDFEDGIDSDATKVGTGTFGSGIYPSISVSPIAPGENTHNFDFGFVSLVAVGNYVWVDTDRDGLQDAGEPPIAGATVELFDSSGQPALDANGNLVAAQTTGADGRYFFDNLLAGSYQVKFTPPTGYVLTTAGTGGGLDSNPNTTTGVTPTFSVALSTTGDTVADTDSATAARFVNPTIDAGVVPLVGVGDVVWVDADRDGVQDAGESRLAGVTVALFLSDGVTPAVKADGSAATATTDVNGNYFKCSKQYVGGSSLPYC